MDGNNNLSRMYSNTGVGIVLPLQPQLQKQPLKQLQNSQQNFQNYPNFMAFTHQKQQPPQQQQQHEQQTKLSMKQPTSYLSYNNPNTSPNPYLSPKPNTSPNPYPSPNQNQKPGVKAKAQVTNSEEDEPNSANDQEHNSLDGKRKGGNGGGSSSNIVSPWQRMKWTDSMVRLLIMAVYYIGDEVVNEGSSKEKKSGAAGVLQKKGKWKSVSKAMMEKGFFVSPQQCEDKFNDLNKRYKRVNDILGRGTACKVVENQGLLDSMDIEPKLMEEVRKLLNSKHLFFREMCAYHNSCGHGTTISGTHNSAQPVAAVGPAALPAAGSDGHLQQQMQQQNQQNFQQQKQQQQQQLQSSCLHSSYSAMEMNKSRGLRFISNDHDDDSDGDDADDEDVDDNDDNDNEEDENNGGVRKRARICGGISSNNSHALQKLNEEIMGVLQNEGKNSYEKKQYLTTQLVQLEEEAVNFQSRALELEKQRLKWLKFSSKKEREMEKMKLDNERQRLENERMMLLLRQREIELLNVDPQHHQQQHQANNPSCVSVIK